jgi:hypothetical protein
MPDLEETARRLEATLRDVAVGLHEVRKWRRRFTVTAALAGVLVMVALAAGGWAIYQVAAAQHESCLAGNASRTANVRLWDHVLALSGSSNPQTARQRAVARSFRVYVHRVYRQRDCG